LTRKNRPRPAIRAVPFGDFVWSGLEDRPQCQELLSPAIQNGRVPFYIRLNGSLMVLMVTSRFHRAGASAFRSIEAAEASDVPAVAS